MIRFNSFPQSSQTVLLLALLLITSFGSACSRAKQNSASDSAPGSSASSSGASATGAGGAFEGAITAKLFSDDQPMEIRYATKGSRMRVETLLSQGSAQTGVMLMDLSSGTQTMLIPQTKTYMTMNWGEMAGQMTDKMTDGKDASGDFPKVTSTGKTETVAGYACQHWLIGDKQDTDICMAKGLGYFGGGGGQSAGILDKLKNLALGDKMKAQIDANPELAKFVEGGAFPLKMSQIENGQSKTIMEVTSVERKSLDDSLFSVPADYKKMEIPGMMGIPAGKK
ncbi:MAG: DUF4412 domain-containing protein [Acidobacteria bacterium]|nr:DUF4412 domain-containing protein [Acidobacteriota bacterium]